jgi:capsule polysaccharide export protein KpsE/RkpR
MGCERHRSRDALRAAKHRRIPAPSRQDVEARHRQAELQKQLADERRKRQNLIGAIEGGADVLSLVAALKEREASITRLEREVKSCSAPSTPVVVDDAALETWVRRQLQDLSGLLRENPERAKEQFRRLHLALTFAGANLHTDSPYFLAFSFWPRADRPTSATGTHTWRNQPRVAL